ncbi:tripartite tricarboxylate transporter TctB family protein [Microbaculum marinisediminis]|uniref:Tripartite tricarboxylate transporter TctB family protein n=1 Tax=Microbaculum marinisediminis TaxID=2931392 RepID=A0AAW5R137_9HYPH|nr:tripartite tricarboxylate transporter TctB family protein [Microbaculum sp. A6E488]MCT8973907.1 tripartite tricarboxylate transporter TctB family protein [Microbaculum sp. A6E488]
MRAVHRDQIVGTLLLVFGALWTAVVFLTVPPGYGENVGPRAFPLGLGILLILLSALMLISGSRKAQSRADDAEDEDVVSATTRAELRVVASVFVIIVGFGFLMEKLGFVIATVTIVSMSMWLVLGIRKPTVIAGMAIGLAGGCWLVFGKILGAYLPPGTWLSLF